ncbi:hypothetical protein CPB85DRAFT_1249469 [Mucidula mucida]|nr:hypothetical protein CPB85DRAFT_1249469 [Mucidula mucida]
MPTITPPSCGFKLPLTCIILHFTTLQLGTWVTYAVPGCRVRALYAPGRRRASLGEPREEETCSTTMSETRSSPNRAARCPSLGTVKDHVSRGIPITDMVADIGDGMVVKYGLRVRPEEAQATELVATKTSGVPFPKYTEKLKGTLLVIYSQHSLSSSSTSSLTSSGYSARALLP